MTDRSLRSTFDLAVEQYRRSRPEPPPELIQAMLAGGLRPGDRVLEVGCGTGQATAALAAHGLSITALELGPAMAQAARDHLARWSNVTVVTGAFEEFTASEPFAAVISVQALHWVEPAIALTKAASLLRGGGSLLLAWHHMPLPDDAFTRASGPIYQRYEEPLQLQRPTPSSGVNDYRAALQAVADFVGPDEFRFAWQHRYRAADYLDLLQTFSNVQAMSETNRTRFLVEIGALVQQHGGTVVRDYESVLLSAHRS